MDYDYLRTLYDSFTNQIYTSDFAIFATIYTVSQEVSSQGPYVGYSDTLDGTEQAVKKAYPQGLKPYYRVRVVPFDKNSLSLSSILAGPVKQYIPGGSFETWDLWVSCYEDDVIVEGDKNLFEFADAVEIHRARYEVRAIVKEQFGRKTVLHILLARETKT